MSAAIYSHAIGLGIDATWETDDIRAMLVTDEYKPNQVRHSRRRDVNFAEVVPSGTYKAGGAPLPGRKVERDGEHLVSTLLKGGTVSWSGFTGSFRYAVVYRAGGTAGQDALIGFSDLGAQTVVNARVTVEYGSVLEFIVENRDMTEVTT